MAPFSMIPHRYDLIKLVTISLLITAILLGGIIPLFASTDSDGSIHAAVPTLTHNSRLVPAFWNHDEFRPHFPDGNPLSDFAKEQSEERRREIGEYLNSLASFPQHILPDELHQYVFVALAPTKTSSGIAIVAVEQDQHVNLIQVSLKPTSKKLIPALETKQWIQELGDSKTDDPSSHGSSARRHYLLHLLLTTPPNAYPAYNDWNQCIFYTRAEIEQYEISAKIQGTTHRWKTTKAQSSFAFDLELKPLPQKIGAEDSPSTVQEVHVIELETRVSFVDLTSTTTPAKLVLYTKNPVVQVQRPARIAITMPSEILETQKFSVKDTTSSTARKSVYIDGAKLSDRDAQSFLKGNHLFPLLGKDKVYGIVIVFESGEQMSDRVIFSDNVLVHTAKPHLHLSTDGEHKCNRLLTTRAVWGISDFAQKYVKVNTPDITFQTPKAVTITDKQSGQVQFYAKPSARSNPANDANQTIRILASTTMTIDPNVVQRPLPQDYLKVSSAPYDLSIVQDFPASVFALPTRFAHPRNTAPEVMVKVTSLDGDEVLETRYELRKREKSGHSVITNEVLPIETHSNFGYHLILPELSIGSYELVLTSVEKATGNPAPGIEHLKTTQAIPIEVKNLAPVTQLRVQKKTNLPMFDFVVTTRDKAYSDIVSKHHIDISNTLREQGYDVLIRHRDLAVYTDRKYVEQAIDTGNRYPNEDYYYDSQGYQGVLHRYNVSTETSVQEGGRYVETQKSETIEERIPNTSGGSAVFTWKRGKWVCTKPWKGKTLPETITRSCPGGGNVVLRKVGAINNNSDSPPRKGSYENETYTIPFDWTAVYNGVCTRTVRVWEPSTTTVHSYTGYYRGYVNTRYQKPYQESLRFPTTKRELLFDQQSPTREALQSLIQNRIQKETIPTHVFLVGEAIGYDVLDRDPDGDATTVKSVTYQHDPSIFDNPANAEDIVGTTLASELTLPGKYLLTRTIQDLPQDMDDQKESSSSTELIVHRKPIALFEHLVRKIESKNGQNFATLEWNDLSYDPDLEKRDKDRGIATKLFRYRPFDPSRDRMDGETLLTANPDDASWTNGLPNELPTGIYVVSLAVQDKLGAWSDVYMKRIDATVVDAVEIKASLRGMDGHTTTAIPAGERLQLYDVTSRFKNKHSLQYQFPDDTNHLAFEDARPLGDHKYAWSEWSYTIPSHTPDGTYYAKVVGTPSGLVTLPYVVSTPIHIQGEVRQSDKITFSATTSIYASKANVTAFVGTQHETKIALQWIGTEGKQKIWSAELDPSLLDMPSDIYQFDFWASTDSGKTAKDSKQERIEFLSIDSVQIQGSWNKWNTSRFLGYEKIKVQVHTRGKAESVSIRFSPELEAMTYTNSKGDIYRYVDEFGYTVVFPLSLTKVEAQNNSEQSKKEKSNREEAVKENDNKEIWEVSYILPIAPSSINWNNKRVRPSYEMWVEAKTKASKATYTTKLDVTGNVHDLMYIRPGLDK